jgi:hypothetical protein
MGSKDGDGEEEWPATLGRLACWLCVALAVVSFCALHALSMRPQAIDLDERSVGVMVAVLLLGGFRESLQFLVPALCLSALLGRLLWLPAVGGAAVLCAVDAGNPMTTWEFEQLAGGGLRARRRRGRAAVALRR